MRDDDMATQPVYNIADIPTKRALMALAEEIDGVRKSLSAEIARAVSNIDRITLDDVPTQGSKNAVTSGGVYSKISEVSSGISVKFAAQSFPNTEIPTSGSISLDVDIPAGAAYVYDVVLVQAWPLTNWSNGAVVSVANKYAAIGSVAGKTSLQVRLTTNSSQGYNIIIGVVYR